MDSATPMEDIAMKNYRYADNRHFSGGWGEFTPADARKEMIGGMIVMPIFLALFAALYIMLPA